MKLKQKALSKEDWLSETGEVHNGAHFPLIMFTENPRARSGQVAAKRAAEKKPKAKAKVKATSRVLLLLGVLIPLKPQSRTSMSRTGHSSNLGKWKLTILTVHGVTGTKQISSEFEHLRRGELAEVAARLSASCS